MITLSVDFLPFKKIVEKAQNFLSHYNPADKIPVPIEDIIELQMKLDIIPTPNLKKNYGIDGCISQYLKAINIDEYIFNNRENRYRFTLAHEVGHIVLHKKYFKERGIKTIADWERFMVQVDLRDWSKIDIQGNYFGGLVLVPPQKLKPAFMKMLPAVDPLIDEAKKKGINRTDYLETVVQFIADRLMYEFEVSGDVISKRINKDSLVDLIE